MGDNMYDERGLLKPEYAWTESQKKAMTINEDIEKIDPRTDFGKGIVFKSIDGGEHASMEDVEQADKAYWDRMMINTAHKDYKDYARYAKLEKAYFDCITPKFNINDKDMTQQVLTAQQEKVAAYIKERYGSYLSELLEQYGYGQQDNNRGPKR